jgi:hypothetical protein
MSDFTPGEPDTKPPLSRDLREFTGRRPCASAAYPIGEPERERRQTAFQSAVCLAVLLPERFRGGCSFGAGLGRSLPLTSHG